MGSGHGSVGAGDGLQACNQEPMLSAKLCMVEGESTQVIDMVACKKTTGAGEAARYPTS